jgi:cytochrome o ubiquinol oxidase subunit II
MTGWQPSIRIAARRMVCPALALLLLPGCSGVLDPQGPVGVADKQILVDSLIIMLAIVIPTMAITIAFAWWYRAGNTKARYLPDYAYSGRVELLVWSIPILVILFLGGIAWIGSHSLDPAQPVEQPKGAPAAKPLEVQVVSLDWKWLFIYPDQGVASVNRLVIPAGRPVHFSLTAASVMNAFFVPRLGSMIYTMNGMTTQLHLQADKPGTYPGLSSHYSGDGFSDMHFDTVALPADQFAGWAAGVKGKGPALDNAAYTELAKQSQNVAPYTYGAVTPDLFQAIASQKVAPGPGPEEGHPNPETSPRSTEH